MLFSKAKKLTSYFKKVSKDEREVEELLATQLSRNSRTVSNESAKTLSTLSSAVMSVIDLTASSDLRPALNAIAEYESDDNEYLASNDVDDEDAGEVESQTSVVFSNILKINNGGIPYL